MKPKQAVWVGCIIVLLVCAASAETLGLEPSSIPYIATRDDTVRDMLVLANVGKNDVVYDLGSGDGRIVIAAVRDFGARKAVGIEQDPKRIAESRENAKKAGVADKVEFIQGDLFETDFTDATVVMMFLGHRANIELRPKLFHMLKPGSRIVSHQFCMGEWQFDKQLTARRVHIGMWGEWANPYRDNPRVPDYNANEMHFGTSDKVTMWVVPAAVAGVWRGKIETADGPQDCKLTLHQRLSDIGGTLEISGRAEPMGAGGEILGNHVKFVTGVMEQFGINFDGHADGDTLQGTLTVRENDQRKEQAWEARRDKADFAGTWELPCEALGRPVRLRIEQREGKSAATFYYREKETPVPDFYDFGGGIYFTYLIGQDESRGLRVAEDTGWLIGEGIIDGEKMKGTVEFYPYPEGRPRSGEARSSKPNTRDEFEISRTLVPK